MAPQKEVAGMYKLCIFDLDGTLIDSLGDLADSVNYALQREGLPTHSKDAYRQMVGNGARKLIERALPAAAREDCPELFDRVYETYERRYREVCLNRTQPYPGVEALLVHLRERGIRLAVLSNKPDAFTRHIAGHFFGDKVDLIVGQRDEVAKKPAPDGVLEILHYFGLSQREAILIGDSDVDVLTAKNAGLRCLGVCWGFRGRTELVQAGADLLAEDAESAEKMLLSEEPF